MFSSMRLRAFLMAFTSAFLCFIVFWMAVLLTNPTAVSSSRQQEEVPLEQGGSLYLPTKSDCMTLLLCEEGEHPSLFFLLRFDPVEGCIPIFAFPQQLVLTHKQVCRTGRKNLCRPRHRGHPAGAAGELEAPGRPLPDALQRGRGGAAAAV